MIVSMTTSGPPVRHAPAPPVTTAMSDGLPFIDLFDPRFGTDPNGFLAGVRQLGPLAVSQNGFEVLDYATCRALVGDPRLVTDHMGLVRTLGLSDDSVLAFKQRTLVSVHGPDHKRLRAPLQRGLSRGKSTSMRHTVRDLVRAVLSGLGDRGVQADLFSDLCQVVPPMLYCHWTSASPDDAGHMAGISRDVLAVFLEDSSLNETVTRAYHQLFDYVRQQVASRETSGLGEDLLSDLIRSGARGDLSPEEVEDEACVLLEASIENTVQQIALVLKCLLERPEVWQALVRDDGLVPAAVAEAMRLEPRTRAIDRLARESVEIWGRTVPAGSNVSLRVMTAQRDPQTFADPDGFVLSRPTSCPSLNFGGGSTSCIGVYVSTMEVEEVVYGLLDAFPGVTSAAPVGLNSSAFLYDVTTIPVSLYD